MRKILYCLCLCFAFFSLCYAEETGNPLPADKAFNLSTYLNQDQQLVLEWHIAEGYFLYRDALHFSAEPVSEVKIGSAILPPGEIRNDILHGTYQAYSGKLLVLLPLVRTQQENKLSLLIAYQGCSKAGFCYPPIKKNLSVDLQHISQHQNLTNYVQSVKAVKNPTAPHEAYEAKLFEGQNLFIVVLSFLGIGLLLAFTPCVLPMVPILSGIIVGHGKKTNGAKPFMLSLVYVSGMALTYAVVGVVIALIGSGIQAQLEKTWVIILFSGVFVLLALSLFGLYELQLPSRFQNWITKWSVHQKSGSFIGVFIMGCLSTLIVSPCVSAPLVGVLAYIGHTGNVVLGALALLALGIGMGIPLLLVGVSAGKILPKAGLWMKRVERLFGVLMLGMAVWMLSRMIPGPVTLFLWGILLVIAAFYLDVFSGPPQRLRWLTNSIGILALVYAAILFIGSVFGNVDPFHPWEQIGFKSQPKNQLQYLTPTTMDELTTTLAKAKKAHQPVMLDFFAKWCSSCLMMDRKVFNRDDVQQALASSVLLRADVTANNAFDQSLLKRFHVIGPPTIIFFDRQGDELSERRIVGEVNAKEFLKQVKNIGNESRANE